MKVLKFKVHADHFETFKNLCIAQEITIKKKLNVLLSEDFHTEDIYDYFPEDHDAMARKMTLKVNEPLFKGVMKKCGLMELRAKDYMAYLIYKYLRDQGKL